MRREGVFGTKRGVLAQCVFETPQVRKAVRSHGDRLGGRTDTLGHAFQNLDRHLWPACDPIQIRQPDWRGAIALRIQHGVLGKTNRVHQSTGLERTLDPDRNRLRMPGHDVQRHLRVFQRLLVATLHHPDSRQLHTQPGIVTMLVRKRFEMIRALLESRAIAQRQTIRNGNREVVRVHIERVSRTVECLRAIRPLFRVAHLAQQRTPVPRPKREGSIEQSVAGIDISRQSLRRRQLIQHTNVVRMIAV